MGISTATVGKRPQRIRERRGSPEVWSLTLAVLMGDDDHSVVAAATAVVRCNVDIPAITRACPPRASSTEQTLGALALYHVRGRQLEPRAPCCGRQSE